MATDVIELKLPPQAQYLALLRRFFEELAQQLGFPALEVEKIVMAVDEALANSVRYHDAWPPGVERVYTIKVSIDDHALKITVQDPGSDFSEAFQQEIALDDHVGEMRSSGLGLYIIKSFMDEVSYERVGEACNELQMVKHFVTEENPPEHA